MGIGLFLLTLGAIGTAAYSNNFLRYEENAEDIGILELDSDLNLYDEINEVALSRKGPITSSVMESKAVVQPEDQARYNKFVDTLYRRVNDDARSTIDPMDVPLKPRETNTAKKAQTSRASVSGIATLTRVGDVSVVNRKDGKELRSAFRIGPVKLKVNRKFGSGKDAILRSATTDGTLSKCKDKNKEPCKNYFRENSIGRITPFASKKLKSAARDVLQATESKN